MFGKVGESDTEFELVIPDRRLREAMLVYSRNVALLSLVISLFTATLVYAAIDRIMIRPIRTMTSSMLAFARAPSDPRRIIAPEDRSDEIGVAERELADMQRQLQKTLGEQKHLADLGLAVSKINHDMRNILASAQLLSDRLSGVRDPSVQAVAPKLLRALDRAVVLFGRRARLWPHAGSAALAAQAAAETTGRRGRGPARRRRHRRHRIRQRGRCRLRGRRRFRTAFPRSHQPVAQRHPGDGRRRQRGRGAAPDDLGGANRQRQHASWSRTPVPACRRRRAKTCSRRSAARRAAAAPGSGSPSRTSWCSRMAVRSTWSKAAADARCSPSPSPTSPCASTKRAAGCAGRPDAVARMRRRAGRRRQSELSPGRRPAHDRSAKFCRERLAFRVRHR